MSLRVEMRIGPAQPDLPPLEPRHWEMGDPQALLEAGDLRGVEEPSFSMKGGFFCLMFSPCPIADGLRCLREFLECAPLLIAGEVVGGAEVSEHIGEGFGPFCFAFAFQPNLICPRVDDLVKIRTRGVFSFLFAWEHLPDAAKLPHVEPHPTALWASTTSGCVAMSASRCGRESPAWADVKTSRIRARGVTLSPEWVGSIAPAETRARAKTLAT